MVTLAVVATALHTKSVRKMARILGMPPPTPGHPLSLRKLELTFLKEARPRKPVDLGAVVPTPQGSDKPARLTLSWLDPGALTFARARWFDVLYFYRGFGGDETIWQQEVKAGPAPIQRLVTTVHDLQGDIGDSTGLGKLFLQVRGGNDFGTSPLAIQRIDE